MPNTVACPYCGQVIPFLAVSCHVVAVHILSDQSKKIVVKPEPVDKPELPVTSNSSVQPPIEFPMNSAGMKNEILSSSGVKDSADYFVKTVKNNGKDYVLVLQKPKINPPV